MFNPLDILRAIRDDEELTGTEKLILMVMRLRADNGTGRVRCSQEQLAKDASVSIRTMRSFYRSAAFARYLEETRSGRRVNLKWRFNPSARIRLIPDTVSPDTVTPATVAAVTPATGSSIPATGAATPATVAGHLLITSASTSASTSAHLLVDPSVKPVEPIRSEYSSVDEYIEAYDMYELHLMQHMEHKLMQLKQHMEHDGALEHHEAPVAPWEPDEPDEPRYVHWRDVDVSDVPKPRKIL